MNRISNPLLMIVPLEALGLMLAVMIVVGGLMIILGARRGGKSLVVTAIALPFISVIVEVLMNNLFTEIPENLVLPVAWLIMGTCYLFLFGALVTMLFGGKAVDHAKGELLASAAKGLLRLIFWWPAMLVWVPMVGYFLWIAG